MEKFILEQLSSMMNWRSWTIIHDSSFSSVVRSILQNSKKNSRKFNEIIYNF